MAVLAAATVCLALLGIANMLLTFGLVRRMRQFLAETPERPSRQFTNGPSVGTKLPEFEVASVDGAKLRNSDVSRGGTVLAFVTSSCTHCKSVKEKLFTEPLSLPVTVMVQAGQDEVGDEAFAAEFANRVSRVAVLPHELSLIDDLGIRGFPTLIRLTDGVVDAVGHTVDDVRIG